MGLEEASVKAWGGPLPLLPLPVYALAELIQRPAAIHGTKRKNRLQQFFVPPFRRVKKPVKGCKADENQDYGPQNFSNKS